MQKIKFGTDGFRAIIAEDFNFSNLKIIGQAISAYLCENRDLTKNHEVVVGYDRRFLSRKFAETISTILIENGIYVLLTNQPVPTPSVSLFVKNKKLPCGIIITASHNPYIFNGIKIKNEFGASATEKLTGKIEQLIKLNKFKPPENIKFAKIKNVEIIAPYIKFLRKYLNFDLFKKNSFKIIIDAMYGVGTGIIEKVLEGTKCQITTIHQEHNPFFGNVNPEPIAKNLAELTQKIKCGAYDLGIALDGDADRIAAMCPDGEYISSHQAICLLLLHFIENRKWNGRLIKTINTTTMADKIAQYYNVELKEVPVGFKNIASEILKGDVLLGGEESGGIGFKNYIPERDGILAGLLLLELIAQKNKSITEIITDMENRFGHFVYLRKDLELTCLKAVKKFPVLKKICGKKIMQTKTYDGTKFILDDESWLLIRASGTEPIVRIYAESKSLKFTQKLINFGCELV